MLAPKNYYLVNAILFSPLFISASSSFEFRPSFASTHNHLRYSLKMHTHPLNEVRNLAHNNLYLSMIIKGRCLLGICKGLQSILTEYTEDVLKLEEEYFLNPHTPISF